MCIHCDILGALMEEMDDGLSRDDAIAATVTVLGDLIGAIEPDADREAIVLNVKRRIEGVVAHRRMLMLKDIEDTIGETIGNA